MYILASSSPRRKELFKLIAEDFKIVKPEIDEKEIHFSNDKMAYELSRIKAYEVFCSHPDDIVLACDTIVIVNNQILGKPKDRQDAIRMLTLLSGKKHIVISGYTIISKKFEISRSVKTNVYFAKLDNETIEEYVDTYHPFDKAGGYGIQDDKFNLIERIDGSYYNVMGLPVEDIKMHLFKR